MPRRREVGNNGGMEVLEGITGGAADPVQERAARALASVASPGSCIAWLLRSICALTVGWVAVAASPSPAHPLSLQECFEGGDFIAHAAQARDNGMTKATFNDKLLADIYLIQAFPPALRWFVQDPEDAEFLLAESTAVFDLPQPPEAHRSDFLGRCFDQKLGTAPTGPAAERDRPDPGPPEPSPVEER